MSLMHCVIRPCAGGPWQERFHRAALELIATTTGGTGGGGSRADARLAAAAATDAAAPALLKIERAAIAAATPISYHPQELLLLVYEHLKASGLHAAAAALAKEAGLAGKAAAVAAAAAAAAAAGPSAGAAGMAAAGAGAHASAPHLLVGSLSPALCGTSAISTLTLAAGTPASDAAAAAAAGAVSASTPAALLTASAARERRRTLSLGPVLLQQLCRETSTEAEQQQQQQACTMEEVHEEPQHSPVQPCQDQPAWQQAQQQQRDGSLLPPLSGNATGVMSPPAMPLVGAKRRASAMSAATTVANGSGGSGSAAAVPAQQQQQPQPGFETPAPKRPALNEQQQTGTAAHACSSAAQQQASPLPVYHHHQPGASHGSGGVSNRRGLRNVSRTPVPLGGSSDSEYLQAGLTLPAVQQHQQHAHAAALLAAGQDLFHTQSLSATAGSSGSNGSNNSSAAAAAAGAAAAGGGGGANAGVRHSGMSPRLWPSQPVVPAGPPTITFSTPSPAAATLDIPHLLAGAFSSAAAANNTGANATTSSISTAHAAVVPLSPAPPTAAPPTAAAVSLHGGAPAPGINALLTNLPSRQATGRAAAGLQRRLSGGAELPHRMTPIAEAAPEPKPLPLHVQVAARDVMTGM
jgi:LisH